MGPIHNAVNIWARVLPNPRPGAHVDSELKVYPDAKQMTGPPVLTDTRKRVLDSIGSPSTHVPQVISPLCRHKGLLGRQLGRWGGSPLAALGAKSSNRAMEGVVRQIILVETVQLCSCTRDIGIACGFCYTA